MPAVPLHNLQAAASDLEHTLNQISAILQTVITRQVQQQSIASRHAHQATHSSAFMQAVMKLLLHRPGSLTGQEQQQREGRHLIRHTTVKTIQQRLAAKTVLTCHVQQQREGLQLIRLGPGRRARLPLRSQHTRQELHMDCKQASAAASRQAAAEQQQCNM